MTTVLTASNPFALQYKQRHPLSAWINSLVVVEVLSRLILQLSGNNVPLLQLGLTIIRSVLWALLVTQLAWRFLYQNAPASMWWTLDYVPTTAPAMTSWLTPRCSEQCVTGQARGAACLALALQFCVNTLTSRLRVYCSWQRTPFPERENPTQVEQEVELVDISRHSKHT